ncbi:transglutaminase domain-containing protein [Microbacterium oleivorans]|uniref:Transglutaminase domain-containing protein n=1 Tax=Microbacterium oleivorans TaxID=273677 RepID=A0A7D5IN96_9MICO|nr:transglutaminase domain-containing protein [Microbacterium oleivorans]QLD10699.1 transglutaminase domain-containing protein [Microbacterium oleivorans]
MSAPGRRDLRARRAPRVRLRFFVAQAALLDLVIAVGAVATWPIYRSAAFAVMVIVASVAAHAIAAAGLRWRWNAWWLAGATIAAYLVLGLPLAAPASLSSPAQALSGAVAVLRAPVTGWKDLLTLELPLGSYQATLAPALVVFLAVPVIALSVAWRGGRFWPLAVGTALLPTVFGIFFGSAALLSPFVVGPVTIPREALVGLAAVVAALGAIVWRTISDRRRAIATAVASTGVRATGRPLRGLAGRIVTAGAMVTAAVVAAALAAPWALAGQPREVLRAGIDPRLEIAAELSPLAQYRASFADETYARTLFRVDAPTAADRVRLATLPFYDGRVARVVDPGAGADDPRTAFARVPSSLPSPAGAPSRTVRVTIDTYDDVWMPTVGAVTALAFDGGDAASLADRFYYNAETRAGVQLGEPGLRAGATYSQDAVVDDGAPSLADLDPARGGPVLGGDVVPESLVTWVEAQEASGGGAGLATLIERLRARGFLSHALTVDEASPPAWADDLGDYAFQPSRAGHSTDRIGRLFSDLLAREGEIGGDDDAALVSAVGDDEQFAVAGMMLADQLGFDARVVVGTRLTSDEPTLSTCDDGVCTAGDLAAWIEVRGDGSTWVPVDVTPQHAVSPSPDTQQRQDPKIPTEVRQEQADTVLPADADPSDGGRRPDDDTRAAPDLTALWTALRVGGVSLLTVVLLFGPFALIVLVKLFRRRARRRADDPVERLTGGWQEFVDAAVDHGHPVPRSQTRRELAAHYGGTAGATELATLADRSVFDATAPDPSDGDRFWAVVDAERSRLDDGIGWWARLRARVSVRSLLRRSGRASPTRRPMPRRRRDR